MSGVYLCPQRDICVAASGAELYVSYNCNDSILRGNETMNTAIH